MNTYDQGFEAKCAELGVDPEELLKHAGIGKAIGEGAGTGAGIGAGIGGAAIGIPSAVSGGFLGNLMASTRHAPGRGMGKLLRTRSAFHPKALVATALMSVLGGIGGAAGGAVVGAPAGAAAGAGVGALKHLLGKKK